MDSNDDGELLHFSFVRRSFDSVKSFTPSLDRSSSSSIDSSSSSSSSSSSPSSPPSPPKPFTVASLKMFFTNNYQNIAAHGIELALAGSYEKAIEYLNLAISLNSSDYRLFYNRAYCYLEINEPHKALEDIIITVRSNPLWAKGYFKLGQSLARMKQFKQAEMAYKKALNLENDCEKETRAEVVGNIYDALIHLGYDEVKAGFAASKYFSIAEARDALEAGAFEDSLALMRSIKRKQFRKKQHKKGILMPNNFL